MTLRKKELEYLKKFNIYYKNQRYGLMNTSLLEYLWILNLNFLIGKELK